MQFEPGGRFSLLGRSAGAQVAASEVGKPQAECDARDGDHPLAVGGCRDADPGQAERQRRKQQSARLHAGSVPGYARPVEDVR